MLKAVIGVDPGASGAMAFINEDHEVGVFRFKTTPWKIAHEIVEVWNSECKIIRIGIEQVGAMPRDARSKRKLATFMKNTGRAEGILYQCGVDAEEINPQNWLRHFSLYGLTSKLQVYEELDYDKAHTKAKGMYVDKARELFPELKITADMADALLIAEYLWRQEFL